jgi:hypothetical protein
LHRVVCGSLVASVARGNDKADALDDVAWTVHVGRLRIWQRQSELNVNRNAAAQAHTRVRGTTLLTPSTAAVPTFVRYILADDTDDELLHSYDAAKHANRSRIAKFIGALRVDLRVLGSRRRASHVLLELQDYIVRQQDPQWCHARIERRRADDRGNRFVRLGEVVAIERLFVTEHLCNATLWHWLA